MRGVLQALRLDEMEQEHRVVIGETPERVIEIAKHLARVRIPAPPQVVCELVEAADTRGQRRQRDVTVHLYSGVLAPGPPTRSLAGTPMPRSALVCSLTAFVRIDIPRASPRRTPPCTRTRGGPIAALRARGSLAALVRYKPLILILRWLNA